jgi:hypothetical protein
MICDGEFIPELAREGRIPRLLKAGKTHELYAGDFGKRARILLPLTAGLVSVLRQEKVAEVEILSLLVDLLSTAENRKVTNVSFTAQSGRTFNR